MTVHSHDETLKDRAAMAAMRAGLKLSPPPGVRPEDRPAYDKLMAQIPIHDTVETSAGHVGGTPGWWCRPQNAVPDRAILYLHGGGYVVGSAAAYRGLASQIAERVKVAIFVADYALAPERPFPAAFEDGQRALVALMEETGGVALVGDSAGGGLALALLLSSSSLPNRPAAAAVFSPWADPTLSGGSVETRASNDPIIFRETLDTAVALYLGSHDPTDPRVNALRGDFTGMPPVRIDVGNDEVILDDALRFHELAMAAGREADVHVWDGMVHVFPANFALLDAAAQALDDACAFLRNRLLSSHQ